MVRVIQKHHITYAGECVKERTVMIYKGEHGVLTKIQWWCKGVCSKGFLEALQQYISEHEEEAVSL